MTRRGAVVLGGGFAGMLAASVLAQRMDVTIVERDRLSSGPVSRRGVPQSYHGNLLLPGGLRAVESLLPGITGRLSHAGAVLLGLPSDVVVLSGQGWMPRSPRLAIGVSCSRSLLDCVVRERVLRDRRIAVVEATDAEGLSGDEQQVTGVVVRNRSTGRQEALRADIVVDATGMSSRAPEWLAALGMRRPREKRVDTGLACASRLYSAPPHARSGFPAVFVRATPGTGQPGRAGALLPIENGQWLISLSGTRGSEPSTDIDGFERFATALRHGVLADLIAKAEPVSAPRGYRNNMNRKRDYREAPRGFLALGDSETATSAVYAQGMSLAASSVVALRDGLARNNSSKRIQRQIQRGTEPGWKLATEQDVLYPEVLGRRRALDGARKRVRDRVQRLAAREPDLYARLLNAHTLSGPRSGILRPRVIWNVLRGVPALSFGEAPFTEQEWAALQECSRRSA